MQDGSIVRVMVRTARKRNGKVWIGVQEKAYSGKSIAGVLQNGHIDTNK